MVYRRRQSGSDAATWSLCLSLVAAGVLSAASAAPAQRANTATLTVGANVLQNCAIQVSDLSFGQYDPLLAHAAAPLDVEATLTTICTPDTVLLVEMDNGQFAQGVARRLFGGIEYLSYDVFKDPGRSQRWGSANDGLLMATPPGQIAPMFRTVYGRIPGGQNISPGPYSDTIQVTLHF